MSTALVVQARSARLARRRSGAVMVEAVIAATALCSLFGCVLLIHLYCSLQLAKLDEARQQVWNTSLPGCGSEANFDVHGLVGELKAGSEPLLPAGAMPSGRRAARTFSVRGIFNASGERSIRFVCNPKPTQKTMNETVQWVLDVFL